MLREVEEDIVSEFVNLHLIAGCRAQRPLSRHAPDSLPAGRLPSAHPLDQSGSKFRLQLPRSDGARECVDVMSAGVPRCPCTSAASRQTPSSKEVREAICIARKLYS